MDKEEVIEIIDNSKYEYNFIDFLMKSKQDMNPETVEFIKNNGEEFQKFFMTTILFVTDTLKERFNEGD